MLLVSVIHRLKQTTTLDLVRQSLKATVLKTRLATVNCRLQTLMLCRLLKTY